MDNMNVCYSSTGFWQAFLWIFNLDKLHPFVLSLEKKRRAIIGLEDSYKCTVKAKASLCTKQSKANNSWLLLQIKVIVASEWYWITVHKTAKGRHLFFLFQFMLKYVFLAFGYVVKWVETVDKWDKRQDVFCTICTITPELTQPFRKYSNIELTK